MGRSSKEEASRNRARIVEVACDLFRARGVDQVSVADIMGALGLTTGGFYKHFASKDALVAEALKLAFTQSSSAWQEVSGHANGGREAHRAALLSHYLRPAPVRRCPMIAFASYAASTSAADASRETYREGAEALLDSFVAPVMDADVTQQPSPAERDAMVLFAAMIGARVLKEAAGDATWADPVRDAVLDAAVFQ